MEFYNPYIKPKYTDSYFTFNYKESMPYSSEIAIVKTKDTIISKDLFYINFKKFGVDGMYLRTEELKKIFIKLINEGYENDIIKNLTPTTYHFCYIKIIKDPQNPHLEGNLMLFKFGGKIRDIIIDHCINYNEINNTLLLNVNRVRQYLSYDDTKFSNNFANYELDRDLNKEVNFKRISIINLLRKEKMDNINRSGPKYH